MNLALITLALFFAVVVADVYMWVVHGSQATISDETVQASKLYPIIPCAIGFLFGFLVAHLFFGVCI